MNLTEYAWEFYYKNLQKQIRTLLSRISRTTTLHKSVVHIAGEVTMSKTIPPFWLETDWKVIDEKILSTNDPDMYKRETAYWSNEMIIAHTKALLPEVEEETTVVAITDYARSPTRILWLSTKALK